MGYRAVGVLGTRLTMESSLYSDALAVRDIRAVRPPSDQIELIDTIIFQELVRGRFTLSSRAVYVDVIERLARAGCDAVVLGCTEIPLSIAPNDSPLPTLSSTSLLAEAAVSTAVRGLDHTPDLLRRG